MIFFNLKLIKCKSRFVIVNRFESNALYTVYTMKTNQKKSNEQLNKNTVKSTRKHTNHNFRKMKHLYYYLYTTWILQILYLTIWKSAHTFSIIWFSSRMQSIHRKFQNIINMCVYSVFTLFLLIKPGMNCNFRYMNANSFRSTYYSNAVFEWRKKTNKFQMCVLFIQSKRICWRNEWIILRFLAFKFNICMTDFFGMWIWISLLQFNYNVFLSILFTKNAFEFSCW